MKRLLMLMLLAGTAWGADNVTVTQGSGKTILGDEVTDGTLGTGTAQFTKIMDGALDGTAKAGVTSNGALKVDISSTGANGTAIKVDNSAVTQPISAASLPLPSGASTAAKQPALGTAGTASADVITVQGITSMTALKVDGSASTQPVNLSQIAGNSISTGNGVSGTGVARVAVASDNTLFTVNISTSLGSFTPGSYIVCASTFANVAASQTDSILVGAISSTKIRIVSATAQAGGTATNLTFNSKGAGAGTAISPLYANAANGGFVLPINRLGWVETNSGESLSVTTGSGSTTGILVNYCKL